jgi:hypothetical protein
LLERGGILVLRVNVATPTRLLACLAALFAARVALADDGNLRVVVVVDQTDAGARVPCPTPEHPVYFYPETVGLVPGQGVVIGQAAPPVLEVQHLLARALADRGYRVASRNSPPTVLLRFSWGYDVPLAIASDPEQGNPETLNAENQRRPDTKQTRTANGGMPEALRSDLMPTHRPISDIVMEDLVFGDNYDQYPSRSESPAAFTALVNEARISRTFLRVTALDYKAYGRKQEVVLWTARISTGLRGRSLDEVLPTLIARGARAFGTDTGGPQLTDGPMADVEQVLVGKPFLKAGAAPP